MQTVTYWAFTRDRGRVQFYRIEQRATVRVAKREAGKPRAIQFAAAERLCARLNSREARHA